MKNLLKAQWQGQMQDEKLVSRFQAQFLSKPYCYSSAGNTFKYYKKSLKNTDGVLFGWGRDELTLDLGGS